MSDESNQGSARDDPGGADEARRKLAQNWASMTASMVAPGGAAAARARPAPLPTPDEPAASAAPAESPVAQPVAGAQPNVAKLPLPATAAEARRAPEPEAEPAPPAPAAPAQPTAQAPAPAPRPAQPAPTVEPSAPAVPAGEPSRPVQPVEPAAAGPQLQPPGPEPRLAPISRPDPSRSGGDRPVARQAPVDSSVVPEAPAARPEESTEDINQSRNNLTAAVSFTIFALVIAMTMTFASQYSTNPAGSDGSGTLLAAIVAIGLAWTVSLAHRLLGRFWLIWYIVPMAILLLGPYISGILWQRDQEALARSYLSAQGQQTMIDADANTIASTIVYTKEGCFSILRNRNTKETSVLVATSVPQTARQQADAALAPRFAAHIPAGGDVSNGRVFFFDHGQGPPRPDTPTRPPLDCGNG